MAEVRYPSKFDRKVLAGEAPGGDPVQVNVVVPTVTQVGKRFPVKLAVLDAVGLPSVTFGGEVRLVTGGGEADEFIVPFREGDPAVASVPGVVLQEAGVSRLRAELGGQQFWSNPTHCGQDPAPRIVWGDPHVHTVLSGCHADRCRSLAFCFVAARHLTGLDWVGAADHVSNARCELARWKEQVATANAYDDPPHFTTLPGYEASLKGGAGGDNNVYLARFPAMFVDEYEDGNVKTMCEKLAEVLPREDFIIVPHHTTRTGKHGEISDDIYPGPEWMPVVEIHSKWGTSEYRGNPNALKEIHPGPSYVVDLLNRGLRLGFIGGTDTHTTMPSGGGNEPPHIDRLPGMTAVTVPELTRDAVFRGIQSRQCYATSLERIYLDGSVDGESFGQRIHQADPAKPRQVQVRVAGRSDVVSIDVVRNGEPVFSSSPDSWLADVTFTDEDNLASTSLESNHLGRFSYYYVRATCASGAQAWSSPVWFTG